jgi:IS5 family transposase
LCSGLISHEPASYQSIFERASKPPQNFRHDPVPDARTIWLFRETLRKAGAVEQVFARFDATLSAHGFKVSGGQIIGTVLVAAPRQRNNRDDNEAIKAGKLRRTGVIKRKRTRTPRRGGRRITAGPFTATRTMRTLIASTS